MLDINLEMIENLEQKINGKYACEARNIVPLALEKEGFKLVHQYEFKKTGVLDRIIDRSIYCDNYNVVIVDFGQEYEEHDGSYHPYYYMNIQVVDECVSCIYHEFY